MVKRSLSHAGLIFYLVISLYPLLWVLNSSFKQNVEIISNPWGLPHHLSFANYVNAWTAAKISTYFWNSLYIATIATIVSIVLASATAYAITRMAYRMASKVVYGILLIALLIPGGSLLIPLYLLIRDIGLYNTPIGLILVYIAFGIPLPVFIMSAFMKTVPRELEEAGIVDGLKAFGLFFRIVFPISIAPLVTVFILDFLGNWNEFIMASLFTSSENLRTLPVGMSSLNNALNMNYGGLCAGIVFSFIPVILIYGFLQNKIIEGVTAGSVKT